MNLCTPPPPWHIGNWELTGVTSKLVPTGAKFISKWLKYTSSLRNFKFSSEKLCMYLNTFYTSNLYAHRKISRAFIVCIFRKYPYPFPPQNGLGFPGRNGVTVGVFLLNNLVSIWSVNRPSQSVIIRWKHRRLTMLTKLVTVFFQLQE